MKFEFMPRYTKYLCWYQTEMEKERSCGFIGIITAVWILALLFGIALLTKCKDNHQPVYTSHYSEEEIKLASIFAYHGSSNPMEMAIAVRKTKNPSLMAAIAIKESNGNIVFVDCYEYQHHFCCVDNTEWQGVSDERYAA